MRRPAFARGAAPVYVSGGAASTGSATCSDSTFTAVVGDEIIAAFSTTNGATGVTPSITDSLGNATGSAFYAGEDSGNNATLAIWVYAVTVGGTDTVSHGDGQGAAFWKSCAVAQYSGFHSVDRSAAASNAATVNYVSGTTAATSQANETLVGIMSGNTGETGCTPAGTGHTGRQLGTGVSSVTFIEDKTVSATGTYQATATMCTAASGIGQILAIK